MARAASEARLAQTGQAVTANPLIVRIALPGVHRILAAPVLRDTRSARP